MVVNKFHRWLFLLGAIFFSPLFFFLIRRRQRKSDSENLRILVIPQLTRVGDLVCSTPALREIKRKYPNCRLAVLATNKNAGIIRNNPKIDRIIIYRNGRLRELIKEIRKERFDWSFCLAGSSFGSLVAFWGLVVNRAKITKQGRPLSEILTDWLNNHILNYRHHTFLPAYYLKILESIGVNSENTSEEVFLSSEGEEKAEKFFSGCELSGADLAIGVSVSAGNKVKEWGDEKFAKIASSLHKKYGAKIIFIGSPKEDFRIGDLINRLEKGNYFKATDFSLEEIPSLIKRLKLFISVDTGPIYIAHALGVPLIDIVGPVDPAEQPPSDEKSFLVLPHPSIKPSIFVFKKPGSRRDHQKAVSSISPDDVLAKADEAIDRFYFQK